MIEKQTFGPFPHRVRGPFKRADLEVYGINSFRPTFTTHVFFNDPDVPLDGLEDSLLRESYAGSFSVFGHSRCVGDDDHCEVKYPTRRFDDRPSHPLTPAYRRVVVTEALRRVLALSESPDITLTVVTVTPGTLEKGSQGRLLECSAMQLVTFR